MPVNRRDRRRMKARMIRAAKRRSHRPLRIVAGGEVSLQAASGKDAAAQPARFSIVGYTGGVMTTSSWGRPIVIDLAGLDISGKSRPALLGHDTSKIVGHTEKIGVVDGELHLEGVVSGVGDASREVVESSRNGFPWQASVGVEPRTIEEVPGGKKARANGRVFNGPVDIVRTGRLNEISFVALGADDDTLAVAAGKNGATAMTFEEWLESKGFDLAKMTAAQKKTMQEMFKAEMGSEGDDEGGGENDRDDGEGDDDDKGDGDGGEGDEGDDDVSAARRRPGVRATIHQLRAEETRETARVAAIRRLCKGKHPVIEANAISGGWSRNRTELAVLKAERSDVSGIRGSSGDVTAAAIEIALCRSAGVSAKTIEASYRERDIDAADRPELRSFSIHSLFGEVVRASGGRPRYGRLDDTDIRAAFAAERTILASGASFSTISLTGVLSSVANKAMLEAFKAAESVVPFIARERDVNDFKEVKSLRLTMEAEFGEVGKSGELKHAGLSEEGFANRLKTYGNIITLTRQMIIDDDLGAFLSIPRMLAQKAAARREKLVISALLGAGGGFFVDNVNSFSGADTALSIEALTVAERAFFERKDSSGEPVLMAPSVLLVSPANKTKADTIYSSDRIVSTGEAITPEKNPHAGKFKPVMSPYLSEAIGLANASDPAWWLFANPAHAAALEVCYLRGRRTPTMESGEPSFETLGINWRSYYDLGVALQERIAAVHMAGEE